MTDADDKPIDVEPGVLACPPAGEAEARAILVSVELNRDGDQEPTGNPWAKAVELAVEPRISEAAGGSNTGWFLFAKPWSVPACIAAFLHGQEQPRVERVPHRGRRARRAVPRRLGLRFRPGRPAGRDQVHRRGRGSRGIGALPWACVRPIRRSVGLSGLGLGDRSGAWFRPRCGPATKNDSLFLQTQNPKETT